MFLSRQFAREEEKRPDAAPSGRAALTAQALKDYMRRRSGAVAQMGERCNRTAEVRGSIPLGSTTVPSVIDRAKNGVMRVLSATSQICCHAASHGNGLRLEDLSLRQTWFASTALRTRHGVPLHPER